jgi:hypothetical protein
LYSGTEKCKLFAFLFERHEEKRPLGKQRCGWEDGIKMDVKETGVSMWIGCETGGERKDNWDSL